MSVLIIVWDSNFDSIHIWLYTSNFPDRFFKVNLFYIKSWSDPVYYDLYCKAILKQNVSIRNCYAEMFSLMFILPICVACIISQNYRNNLSFPQRKTITQPSHVIILYKFIFIVCISMEDRIDLYLTILGTYIDDCIVVWLWSIVLTYIWLY